MIEAEEVDDRGQPLDDDEELDEIDDEERPPPRKYQKIVVVRADGGSETREVLAKPGIRTPQVNATSSTALRCSLSQRLCSRVFRVFLCIFALLAYKCLLA